MMDIEKRGNLFSAVSTAVIFMVLIILSIVIKFKPKEKFNPIVIQLEPPLLKEIKKTVNQMKDLPADKIQAESATSKSESKSEPRAEQREPEKITQKEVQEKAASKTPEKKDSAKTLEKKPSAPKKSEPNPSKAKENAQKAEAVKEVPQKTVEEPKIRKSIEELMAEQNSAAKKKVAFDESLFADDDSTEESSVKSAQPKVATQKSSMDGTSATSSDSGAVENLSSSSSSRSPVSQSASDSTREALSGIKNTTFSSTVSDGVKSRASIVSSKSSSGEVSIQMSDGSARQLLHPKNPSIFISEENARLVDNTREVEIRFTVKADGSVPFGEITIRPSSLLPAAIQSEIKMQISEWKFSEEPSGHSGIASFGYTLEIR